MKRIAIALYQAFIWRWNLYIANPLGQKIFDLYIYLQRKNALRIYDFIIDYKEISKIKHWCRYRIISREIRTLLDKLEHIGYVKELEPLRSDFKVTVVIAHYNHQRFIGQALESLAIQTVLPDEIIIIDDISPDYGALVEIVESFKSFLPIKLIRAKEKLYCGPAKQFGAEIALGDVIVMHDADDIAHPQRIETIKIFYSKYPDALALSMGIIPFSGTFLGFNEKKYDLNNIDNYIISTGSFIDRHRYIFEHQLFFKRKKAGIVRRGSYGAYGSRGSVGSSGMIVCRKAIYSKMRYSNQQELRDSFTDWDDYELYTLMLLSARRAYAIDLDLFAYRQDASTYILHWQE